MYGRHDPVSFCDPVPDSVIHDSLAAKAAMFAWCQGDLVKVVDAAIRVMVVTLCAVGSCVAGWPSFRVVVNKWGSLSCSLCHIDFVIRRLVLVYALWWGREGF